MQHRAASVNLRFIFTDRSQRSSPCSEPCKPSPPKIKNEARPLSRVAEWSGGREGGRGEAVPWGLVQAQAAGRQRPLPVLPSGTSGGQPEIGQAGRLHKAGISLQIASFLPVVSDSVQPCVARCFHFTDIWGRLGPFIRCHCWMAFPLQTRCSCSCHWTRMRFASVSSCCTQTTPTLSGAKQQPFYEALPSWASVAGGHRAVLCVGTRLVPE